ncbi:MAG: penicillin-binding protein 2, partial [Candidatus Sumerlaeia bacterium]|nr:penicillin-binding protein 2 [Candidatus Sumerlaeia bacterium]
MLTRAYKLRLLVVTICLMIGFICLAIRLYYIQIVCHQTYVEQAARQHYAVIEIAPRRGDIVDRNGDVLATSTMVYSVYCEPKRIKPKE